MEEANLRSDKLKWDSTNLSFERDKTCGYSWPQRNYPCAFCKKQFKSAQALGGHMNIHRRERAQLRSLNLSPNPLDYPNPNPKPKPTFLPYASCLTSLTPTLASALSSKSSDRNIDEETMLLLKPHSHQLDQRQKMRNEAFLGFGKLKGFTEEDEVCEFRVLKKNEGLELGLGLGMGMGMGLLRDGEGDLDLELRLGLS